MTPTDEEALGRRLRQTLNAGTANLQPHVASRLMQARQAAMAKHVSNSGFMARSSVLALGDVLYRFRLIAAAVALCIGGIGSYYWNIAQDAIAAADIDSALLADDVPPNAYIDPGFRLWLSRASSESSSE